MQETAIDAAKRPAARKSKTLFIVYSVFENLIGIR